MSEPGTLRFPCAVCGDPWTLESDDYVTLIVEGRDGTQWLGAHASCLNRFFKGCRVNVGGDDPAE